MNIYLNLPSQCECSSGVEHHLAKVRVVGPNPITRSSAQERLLYHLARVVELVDTLDLKSNGHYVRTGSSPVPGTKSRSRSFCFFIAIDILYIVLETNYIL